jgi:hypothetical protein
MSNGPLDPGFILPKSPTWFLRWTTRYRENNKQIPLLDLVIFFPAGDYSTIISWFLLPL